MTSSRTLCGALLGGLLVCMAGCGGGSSGSGLATPAPDAFVVATLKIAANSPDDTEPVDIDAIVATSPEDVEPVSL
jgi:hypothetical protein